MLKYNNYKTYYKDIMSLKKTIKYINFHNNTNQCVILETWIEVMDGLSSFKSKTISPGEKLIIHSSVGEWFINDDKYCYIGKFTANPSFSGNYSWIENENVIQCVYSETNENDIIGLITFSKILDV
jgi:hypothetical protein